MVKGGVLSSTHGTISSGTMMPRFLPSHLRCFWCTLHALGVFAAQDVCAVQYGQQLFRWPHLPGWSAGARMARRLVTEVTAIVTAAGEGETRLLFLLCLLLLHLGAGAVVLRMSSLARRAFGARLCVPCALAWA